MCLDSAARYVHLRHIAIGCYLHSMVDPLGHRRVVHHAGLVLNALQRWEELLWLLIPAFAYSLVVATRLGSIYIVV